MVEDCERNKKKPPPKAMGEVFLNEIYFENLLYKFILVSKYQLIIKGIQEYNTVGSNSS